MWQLANTMHIWYLHFFPINQILKMLSYIVAYFFSNIDQVPDSLFWSKWIWCSVSHSATLLGPSSAPGAGLPGFSSFCPLMTPSIFPNRVVAGKWVCVTFYLFLLFSAPSFPPFFSLLSFFFLSFLFSFLTWLFLSSFPELLASWKEEFYLCCLPSHSLLWYMVDA